MRQDIENVFEQMYQQALRMAEKVNVEPAKPRTTGRQRHRANAPAESVKEYYMNNIAIPFLDHIISELDARFSSKSIFFILLYLWGLSSHSATVPLAQWFD